MICIYFILWLIFIGQIGSQVIITGVLISFLLDYLLRNFLGLNFNFSNFVTCLKLFPVALLYLIILLIGIIKANFIIIKIVLAKNIELEPCLVTFKTSLETDAARVTLANSITLTPGTITVSLENDTLMIHALNRDMAEAVKNSIFEKILKKMEVVADARI